MARLTLKLATAAGLLLCTFGAVVREEVSFSNAWRFHLGPGGNDSGGGPGNNWSFPTLISNCTGLYPNPNRVTPFDCEVACAYNAQCERAAGSPIMQFALSYPRLCRFRLGTSDDAMGVVLPRWRERKLRAGITR